VERPEVRVERIETETAVLRHAVDPLAARDEVRCATQLSIPVSNVQDGREERYAVHHRTFDQLRNRRVRARRQTTRSLDHEGRRSPLSVVPVTQCC